MDRQQFIELLNRYQEGKATKSELELILRYYNLFQSAPDALEGMDSAEKMQLREQIRQGIRKNIERTKQQQAAAPSIMMWKAASIVAAAAVVIAAFVLVLRGDKPAQPRRKTSISFIRNGNHVISLPDGSTVTLSSGSELNYAPSFDSAGTREVFLVGQAFFDVRHDVLRPFIVHAGKVRVRVLGTAFNVKAYSMEKEVTVTVKRGKVLVSNPFRTLGTITPDQQIVYNEDDEKSLQQVVNSNTYLEWKKLDCLFDNLTIREVATLLEDRYGVKIIVDDKVTKSERFTATFPQNELLEEALTSICEFNNAKYQYDKEKRIVTISKKL